MSNSPPHLSEAVERLTWFLALLNGEDAPAPSKSGDYVADELTADARLILSALSSPMPSREEIEGAISAVKHPDTDEASYEECFGFADGISAAYRAVSSLFKDHQGS